MLGIIKNIASKRALLKIKAYQPFLVPVYYAFSSPLKLTPVYLNIKKAYLEKGRNSFEYQQEMGKAMREAISKFDYSEAVNLELFHLSLVKESEGQYSLNYRSQLRQVARFCINRYQFQTAAKVIQQLQIAESKSQNVSPLDVIATFYLQGHVYLELGRLDESKQALNNCLAMKQVQQGPEVFFKIFAQLAKVHLKANEKKEAYEKIEKCQQILRNRKLDPEGPPMLLIMDLQDIFQLAQITSTVKDKQSAWKYMDLYLQKLQGVSNKKDPIYGQYLQRMAKVHFNLGSYPQSIKLLIEAANISQQLGKQDPKFLENAQTFRQIAKNIEEKFIKKK